MTQVKFFAIPGDPDNEALAHKLSTVECLRTQIYACPREMAAVYPMPFIQVEGGERFYGEEAIELFLSEKATPHS